jgi:chorismate mutase/prephenate dehydratase
MADGKREVDELRQEIAKLDAQLLVALEKRAKAARKIGELRKDQVPALPLQDRASIQALVMRASEMPHDALRSIFREVFAACLALELPVKVAYVGGEGGPGHVAARARFGPASQLAGMESAAAALDEVARKRAEFAVVPFETSTDGPVQSTIVALVQSDLRISEQLESAFDLHLMNRTGNAGDIEKVYATPADAAACQKSISQHAPRARVLDVKSATMACQLSLEDHGSAALVSDVLGASSGLELARKSMLDRGADRVRYAIIGTRPSSRSGSDMTAFVFAVQDQPGSLLDVLKQIAERGINMTKIQSRPMQGEAWAYLFFVEVHGHFTDRPLISTFEEIKRATRYFKVLGSYPSLG